MPAQPSLQSSIETVMGSLDLTLESELTLFRNRHLPPQEEASTPDATSASQPTSSSEIFNSYHEDDTILEVSSPASPRSEDLASEAARLLDVDLGDDDIEPLATEAVDWVDSPSPASVTQAPMAENPAGAIVPSKALLPSDPDLAGSATLETYTDPALDDYLESSEVLLKHLDTPSPREPLEQSVSLKWFGWAAGATLALSLLAAFFLQNVFKTPPPPSEQPSTSTQAPQASTPSPAPPNTETSAEVTSPDLSSKEFQPVKPGGLAELPSPETTGSSPSSSSATADREAPAPSATSSRDQQPSPRTETAQTEIQTGVQTPERFYYVVTEYVDEASLEAARQVVSEAKVVNFTAGTRIQLQKFSDESTARTAAANYEQQGLAIEILATATE